MFLGSASGIVASGYPSNADSQLEPDQINAQLGFSIAGAGGRQRRRLRRRDRRSPSGTTAGQTKEGAAFVFLGSASGIVASGNPSNADSQLESNQIECAARLPASRAPGTSAAMVTRT